jgi:hypothetical protein
VCTQAKADTNHVRGTRVSPSAPPHVSPRTPFPCRPCGESTKLGIPRLRTRWRWRRRFHHQETRGAQVCAGMGTGTPRPLGSLPPPPPAPRCGETRGCGRGGTGGSGGDKGQELGVPAAAPPRPGTEGTSGAAPAATLPQTPGLTRGPVALNPSSPVSQIRPTLTIPDCRVSCCPLLLLGSASHSDRS